MQNILYDISWKAVLKDIAKFICEKYNKTYDFDDNKKPTYLIADNLKLRKFFKIKKKTNLTKLIF